MKGTFATRGAWASPMLALLCLVFCLFLAGCSSKKDPYAMPKPLPADSPEKVVWNAEPGAITVIIDAQSDANLIDGMGHATSLCLMQVPDAEKILALGADEQGLRALLACKPAPPDIITATQLFVQPGSYRVFPLDRAARARHIAVAAGFNTLTSSGCLAVVPIPVHEDSERSYLFFSHPVYAAADMNLAIDVGQASISVRGAERDN